jgi:3-isopropylmalate dehydrogenase
MRLAVLPGDDIGPEITDATLTVLDAADRTFSLGLEYDVHGVGMQALSTTAPRCLMRLCVRSARQMESYLVQPA